MEVFMTPIKTPYSNITYVAEGCNDLPATLTKNPSGQDEVETCWELTDEEVEQVIKNKKVLNNPLFLPGQSSITSCILLQCQHNI